MIIKSSEYITQYKILFFRQISLIKIESFVSLTHEILDNSIALMKSVTYFYIRKPLKLVTKESDFLIEEIEEISNEEN